MDTMNQNDRETLVRMEQNLINLTKEVGEVKGLLTGYENRIRDIEISQGNCKIEVTTLKEEVNRLRSDGNIKDTVIAIGTVIAGILAVIMR